MMRAATFLWALLATIAGAGLFLLKYQVQAEERHLKEVRKDIVGTEQSIHVLKAEWSYLNDPVRLREQAEHHLGMHPMRANQIVSIGQVPLEGDAPYLPPGLVAAKPHLTTPATPKSEAPAHRPLPQGKIVTAKLVKKKRDLGRPTEVASSKVRP